MTGKLTKIVYGTNKGKAVFTRCDIAKGAVVVRGRPVGYSPTRTRHTLQMDWSLHAIFDEPSCLINHSCMPNTGVIANEFGGYDFVALDDISAGDEISFDYATTEYFSIAVPSCICGASNCRKKITGFEQVPRCSKVVVDGFVAPYIKNYGYTIF